MSMTALLWMYAIGYVLLWIGFIAAWSIRGEADEMPGVVMRATLFAFAWPLFAAAILIATVTKWRR